MRSTFVVRWTGASFLGWTLGFVLMLGLIAVSGGVGLGDAQFPVGLGMGAGVGIVQARRFREIVGGAHAWWLASALGVAAPFIVSDLGDVLQPDLPYALPVLVATGGALTGVAQWSLLRARYRRARLWVPAAGIGWLLASASALVDYRWLGSTLGPAGALVYVALILGGGVLLGVAEGVALRFMTANA